MATPKLDRMAKALFRQRLKAWQRADQERRAAEIKADMIRIATRLLHAEWGAPEIQADMAIVAKYCPVHPITGANLRVYFPAPKGCGDYAEAFGVEHDFGLLKPGGSTGYGGKVFHYWHGHVDPDDPDITVAQGWIHTRHNWQREYANQTEALDQAMRETSSVRKIEEAFPYLKSESRP